MTHDLRHCNLPPNPDRIDVRLPQKSQDMLFVHPDELTSAIEQVAHQLEDKGFQIQHLRIASSNLDEDPEDDPGSISWIYNHLLSSLPSQGLTAQQIRTKERLMRETAVNIGLSNIGVLKSDHTTETIEPLRSLRRFIHIDPEVSLSDAASQLLGKWDEPNHIETAQTEVNVRKRRRVQLPASQQEVVVLDTPRMTRSRAMMEQMTLSQPERGRHGGRNLRPKTRRSGF